MWFYYILAAIFFPLAILDIYTFIQEEILKTYGD